MPFVCVDSALVGTLVEGDAVVRIGSSSAHSDESGTAVASCAANSRANSVRAVEVMSGGAIHLSTSTPTLNPVLVWSATVINYESVNVNPARSIKHSPSIVAAWLT